MGGALEKYFCVCLVVERFILLLVNNKAAQLTEAWHTVVMVIHSSVVFFMGWRKDVCGYK